MGGAVTRRALTIVLGVAVLGSLCAQSATEGLAPQIPSYREQLPLFVRELSVVTEPGRSVRIVRYGKAGELEEPGPLDLPLVGRSFSVHAYDLIEAGERAVELRLLESYEAWLELDRRSYAILIDGERAELVYGSIVFFGDPGYASELSAGAISIYGYGRARIVRDTERIVVAVEEGRYEILTDGRLFAALGPGQERRVEIAAADRDRSIEQRAQERFDTLIDRLNITLFSEWSTGALDVDGNDLVPLWGALRALSPFYAAAMFESAQWIRYPDIWERRIGEALRVLAAYSFSPPPAHGR